MDEDVCYDVGLLYANSLREFVDRVMIKIKIESSPRGAAKLHPRLE